MLHSIIGSGLKFRYLFIVLAAVISFIGFRQTSQMPIDVLPEFSPPFVEIQTEALGLSAKEVEQLITVPIEQDLLSGVAWIDTIRSKSVPGVSSILLLFEPGTDLYRARQMVSERLTQAHALPHVSKPPTMLQPYSATSRFMIVGLSSKEITPIQMSVLTRWTVVPRLMSVPGVANVAVWGQRDRQLQVQVDPERLRANNVTLQQVLESTGNALWVSSLSYLEASTPGTGGFIDTPQQRLGIWHISPINSAAELAKISVEDSKWKLGDVAKVVEDHQPLIGDAIASDKPSLILVIEKLPQTNTLDVTNGVEEAMQQMKPGMPGIEINTTLYRPASYIQSAVSNLGWALMISAVLVIVVLLLFLFSWRTALIAGLAIAASVGTALFVLQQRGATLNVLVLIGFVIAIGSVLDDAIVDADHIARRLRQLGTGSNESLLEIIADASAQARGTLLSATLILLLLAVPIFFIEGVTGAFVHPMATSYAIAILSGLVVGLVVTPTLCFILAPKAPDASGKRRNAPIARMLQGYFNRMPNTDSYSPRLAYVVLVALVIASLAAIPVFARQRQTLPNFKEPDLLISLEGAPGMSHPAMVRITNQAMQELQKIAGVRNIGVHIGRAIFGDEIVGVNSAKIWVNIDSAADYNTTLFNIQEVIAGYAGLQQSVQTYLKNRSDQIVLGSSANNTLVARVFGENIDVLKTQAENVRQAISVVDGVANAQVKLPVEEPTVEIAVDLAKAQQYGVKPGDVRRAAAILLSGLQVGSLFEDQKVFDIVVWSLPEKRQSLTHIRELLIDTPRGGRVRLQDVADVRIASSPNVIQRESISPYVDVSFEAQGRNVASVATDVEMALKGMRFPLEYHARVLGDFAAHEAAQQRIGLTVLMVAIGILLLLQTVCERWPLTWLVFLTLPLSLAGSWLITMLMNNEMSALSILAGMLAVFGITARHAVMTINLMHHLQREDRDHFGPALIMQGARERIVPILASTLSIFAALLPFVVFGDRPGIEIVRQISLVVIGGLISSTLFNLFIIPALYLRFGRITETVEWMSEKFEPLTSE